MCASRVEQNEDQGGELNNTGFCQRELQLIDDILSGKSLAQA